MSNKQIQGAPSDKRKQRGVFIEILWVYDVTFGLDYEYDKKVEKKNQILTTFLICLTLFSKPKIYTISREKKIFLVNFVKNPSTNNYKKKKLKKNNSFRS